MAALVVEYTPRTTVILSGVLARKFFRKKDYVLESRNTWEVFKALKATLDGFAEEIRRLERLGMRFAIFRNRRNVTEADFERGGASEVRIVPVISGSKRGGVFQTVTGVVLIAAALIANYFFPGNPVSPYLLHAGVAMVIGGVVQMLSPQLGGLSQSASPDNLPSYAFGSAKNTTASGNPVPICIGDRRWGGAIISASIYAEDKV